MTTETGTKSDDNLVAVSDIFALIWRKKKFAILVMSLFIAASLGYSVSLNNIYLSEATLSPAIGAEGASGLKGNLGGLASLAGISMGSSSADKVKITIEIAKSRLFFKTYVEKHLNLPEIYAFDSWDVKLKKLNLNNEIFDSSNREWRVVDGKTSKPSLEVAHRVFLRALSIFQDETTGLVKISYRHVSPVFAESIVRTVIEDLNEIMRQKDAKDAQNSIKFLEKKAEETDNQSLKISFYDMILEQNRTLMMTEARDEYIFSVIDPAIQPEVKYSPNRAFICVVGAFLGGVMSIFLIIARDVTSQHRKPR